MVGVVVATHGELAEVLLRTVGAVCGPLESARAVTLSHVEAIDVARADLAKAISEVDDGDGVLVLTDMLGGTPANLALTFLDEKVEVITGVNLPMILKLATARADSLALRAAAELVTSYGQKNITLASELLRSRARTSRT